MDRWRSGTLETALSIFGSFNGFHFVPYARIQRMVLVSEKIFNPWNYFFNPLFIQVQLQDADSNFFKGELPRGYDTRPEEHVFSPPPLKHTVKQARGGVVSTGLNPIDERVSTIYQNDQADGSTSELTDMDVAERGRDPPKKVQKGQINSLAKMLFTLKANKSPQ